MTKLNKDNLKQSGAIFFILKYKKEKIAEQQLVPQEKNQITEKQASETEATTNKFLNNETQKGSIKSNVSEGDIEWIAPQEVLDINIFLDDYFKDSGCQDIAHAISLPPRMNRESVKYYKVGKIIKGEYKGGDFLLVQAPCNFGPSFKMIHRFIKINNSLFLLNRYSDPIDPKKNLIDKKFKLIIDNDFTIKELEFPKILYGSNSKQKLVFYY